VCSELDSNLQVLSLFWSHLVVLTIVASVIVRVLQCMWVCEPSCDGSVNPKNPICNEPAASESI
jgi:hypothetical protein